MSNQMVGIELECIHSECSSSQERYSISQLQEHYTHEHFKRKLYTCFKCKRQFGTEAGVTDHLRDLHVFASTIELRRMMGNKNCDALTLEESQEMENVVSTSVNKWAAELYTSTRIERLRGRYKDLNSFNPRKYLSLFPPAPKRRNSDDYRVTPSPEKKKKMARELIDSVEELTSHSSFLKVEPGTSFETSDGSKPIIFQTALFKSIQPENELHLLRYFAQLTETQERSHQLYQEKLKEHALIVEKTQEKHDRLSKAYHEKILRQHAQVPNVVASESNSSPGNSVSLVLHPNQSSRLPAKEEYEEGNQTDGTEELSSDEQALDLSLCRSLETTSVDSMLHCFDLSNDFDLVDEA